MATEHSTQTQKSVVKSDILDERGKFKVGHVKAGGIVKGTKHATTIYKEKLGVDKVYVVQKLKEDIEAKPEKRLGELTLLAEILHMTEKDKLPSNYVQFNFGEAAQRFNGTLQSILTGRTESDPIEHIPE